VGLGGGSGTARRERQEGEKGHAGNLGITSDLGGKTAECENGTQASSKVLD
jgi:hypothetical protein